MTALVAGCATASQTQLVRSEIGLERWEIRQLKPAPNVDVFVHDFEGSAGLVVPGEGVTYIVGWPTYVITDETREELAAGIIWTSDDSVRLLPKPPGMRRMVSPEGVSDGRGGLHLIWGDSPDSLATRATELQYGHFDGVRWDERDKLDTISGSLWGFGSQLIHLASGDLLFFTQTGLIDRKLARFRRHGSTWIKTAVSTRPIAGPSYLRLAELAPGTLVLAGVSAGGGPGESDQNSVFASRSTDDGDTWTPFQRVNWSLGRLVHHLRMAVQEVPSGSAVDSSRAVFLVWHTPGVRSDSVQVRRSSDGGITWEVLPSLPLRPSSRGVEAVASCDGALDVAAYSVPSDTSKLGELTVWRWMPPNEVASGGWLPRQARVAPVVRSGRFLIGRSGPLGLVLGTARERNQTPGDLMAITAYAARPRSSTYCENEPIRRRP